MLMGIKKEYRGFVKALKEDKGFYIAVAAWSFSLSFFAVSLILIGLAR